MRLIGRNGSSSLAIERIGLERSWGDVYHFLLTISWTGLLLLVIGLYLFANVFFAGLYLLGGDAILNARHGSFEDAFFFSVQTLATIGYGVMSPKTTYGHIIASIEGLVGWSGFALATGLMFAKFSKPTARVLFSDVAVINQSQGRPTLFFRTANRRRNQIFEAQVRLTLARDETLPNGEFMRRFYDMKLVRGQTSIFALTWTIMHVIDEESPLFGQTSESLAESQTELIVTLTGLDDTVSQNIHARHSFIASEILFEHRLTDIITRTPEGRRILDYSRFHDVEALVAQPETAPPR
ncbi:ion channel [Gloeobacter kilaueensis]|uniref:Inward rectifier potassium channel n=1 Tax=Gloeobacter kilaueensis (strain ATCC BAA-2537 / CCAP 1431/1 / ULC 316 / JS1) TaxID=1183438 RepID=U5QPK1_GLOK1|nr:ion channel [Gloeobacter kilaueensis]AGY59620.1 hypothetical protein GKIL_3374 [Gloeobacter kilaueensis JS1]